MDKLKLKKLQRDARDIVMITLSMIFYSIGWSVFLLPNHITTGGVAGISSIIFWGTGFPVQYTYFLVNAVLLVFALKILGWKFCAKTIYAVVILTLILQFFSKSAAEMHLLQDQPFMACIIGSIFCGSGIGLCLANNGSTGGTDIVAAIVNKYRDISLGRVILILDIFIITSSYIVLKDWEMVIYGYVVLFIVSFCIDQVVNSTHRSVQLFIISEKNEEIAHRINQQAHRGCTVIDGEGSYTGNPVKMLFVLAKRRESGMIFSIINDVDPKAFVSQSSVIGVYGEGFDHFKVRRPQKEQPKEQS